MSQENQRNEEMTKSVILIKVLAETESLSGNTIICISTFHALISQKYLGQFYLWGNDPWTEMHVNPKQVANIALRCMAAVPLVLECQETPSVSKLNDKQGKYANMFLSVISL